MTTALGAPNNSGVALGFVNQTPNLYDNARIGQSEPKGLGFANEVTNYRRTKVRSGFASRNLTRIHGFVKKRNAFIRHQRFQKR